MNTIKVLKITSGFISETYIYRPYYNIFVVVGS